MNEKILDFEDNEFSEFDYITDFYIPFKDEEQKYSSPELKLFRDNNIDPYELLGEKKVDGIEPITKLKQGKEIEEAKTSFAGSVLDFVKDLPESAFISTAEAMANLTNTGVQLVGFGSNFLFKDSEKGKPISDFTTDIAQNYNKGTENFINSLDTYAKNNDINGVSKLLTDTGIDIGLTFPIQKQLKKVGMPNWLATPLAFGLSYGLTGGDKDVENNMLVDSQVVNRTLELMNVLPNTPEAEIAELVANTFEGTLWAGAIQPITKVFKLLKNNVPAYLNQQTAVSVGGAAAVGETVDKINQNVNPELNVDQPEQPIENLDQEKKTLNQSDTLQDADNLYASAGFGPVFFSMLKEAAKKIPSKGLGSQILNQLKNTQGVKQAELKWSGLDEYLLNNANKKITKDDIQLFLRNNALDVSEVKFTGKTGIPFDLKKRIDDFKNRWTELSTKELNEKVPIARWQYENLNFDQYRVAFGTEKGSMDFNTLRTVLGEEPSLKKMAKLNNGNLITKDDVIKNKSLIKEDAERLKQFQISPIEFEKYVLENERRLYVAKYPKTKFEQYTEAGGKDYTELVFKIKNPVEPSGKYKMPIQTVDANRQGVPRKGEVGYKPNMSMMEYKSPHFKVENEFAHVRFKTRDLNGQKVLTVEEMQSDLLQAMKRDSRIKDFPFANNWYELTIKRLLRYAADNNFDAVAIPKGSVAAKRYGQSLGKAKSLKHYRQEDGTIVVSYLDEAGEVIQDYGYAPTRDPAAAKPFGSLIDLENEVGKKLAKQIEDAKGTRGNIFLETPLVIGEGKGKAELYDKAIPSFMKKYGKKWNAQVYDDVIEGREYGAKVGPLRSGRVSNIPVTVIKLTDEMKQSIQQDGQALFSLFGLGLGSKIASDSIENNIISDQTN